MFIRENAPFWGEKRAVLNSIPGKGLKKIGAQAMKICQGKAA